VTIVPLGIGPEPNLLRSIAPGVVWVAALLAAILSLPRLFANDFARWHAGADAAVCGAPDADSCWQGGRALAGHGLPLTLMSIVFGVAFDIRASKNQRDDRFAAAGHAGIEPDRRRWRALTLGLRGVEC